jgi:Ca2+-binding EF-hand superfamily protein
MKSAWTFSIIMAGVVLVGTMVDGTNASGQKTSGNQSGTKLWLTAMDTDKDGTVSKEEFTTYMQAQFDKADSDNDGTLDRNELEHLRQAFGITTAFTQKTSSSTPNVPRLSMTALDKDNDGTVSEQEFMAYMQVLFDKADADHDGTLDRNELGQLRKSLGIPANK